MATLFNHTDADLFCAPLHLMVPAHESVDITDEDAERVNTVSGVWVVERATATRSAVKRGGKVAETSGRPQMETR